MIFAASLLCRKDHSSRRRHSCRRNGHLRRRRESGDVGAWLEFRGVVRGEENGRTIRALEYEAYPEMAGREIRRLLQEISARHPCSAAKIIHRVGVIPVGETAIRSEERR